MLSAIFICGLFLTRLYSGKYHALSLAGTEASVRQALAADEMLVIALPMWIVAFVTVLVSHALIPDETDYRVLTPLPVDKRLIFGAKLSAPSLFAGLFIIAAQLAVLLQSLHVLLPPWQAHGHVHGRHLVRHVRAVHRRRDHARAWQRSTTLSGSLRHGRLGNPGRGSAVATAPRVEPGAIALRGSVSRSRRKAF